jgi:GH24 family phage-related lysozyme (muramidase)
MKTSQSGIDAIKKFEGFTPTWVKDVNNVSIGYGHNKLSGDNFTKLTEAEATELLKKDLIKFENIINRVIKIQLNQNQFDALVMFVYNTGRGESILYDLINQKADIESIIKFWNEHYITADGKVLPGLIKRRAYESALFASHTNDTTKNTFIPGIALLVIIGIVLKNYK